MPMVPWPGFFVKKIDCVSPKQFSILVALKSNKNNRNNRNNRNSRNNKTNKNTNHKPIKWEHYMGGMVFPEIPEKPYQPGMSKQLYKAVKLRIRSMYKGSRHYADIVFLAGRPDSGRVVKIKDMGLPSRSISIRLPGDICKELDNRVRSRGVSVTEVITESLRITLKIKTTPICPELQAAEAIHQFQSKLSYFHYCYKNVYDHLQTLFDIHKVSGRVSKQIKLALTRSFEKFAQSESNIDKFLKNCPDINHHIDIASACHSRSFCMALISLTLAQTKKTSLTRDELLRLAAQYELDTHNIYGWNRSLNGLDGLKSPRRACFAKYGKDKRKARTVITKNMLEAFCDTYHPKLQEIK